MIDILRIVIVNSKDKLSSMLRPCVDQLNELLAGVIMSVLLYRLSNLFTAHWGSRGLKIEVAHGSFGKNTSLPTKNEVDLKAAMMLELCSYRKSLPSIHSESSTDTAGRPVRRQESVMACLSLDPQTAILDSAKPGPKSLDCARTVGVLQNGEMLFQKHASHSIFLLRNGSLQMLSSHAGLVHRQQSCSLDMSPPRDVFSKRNTLSMRAGDRLLVASGGIRLIHKYDLFLIMKNTTGAALQLAAAIQCALKNRGGVVNTGYFVLTASRRR